MTDITAVELLTQWVENRGYKSYATFDEMFNVTPYLTVMPQGSYKNGVDFIDIMTSGSIIISFDISDENVIISESLIIPKDQRKESTNITDTYRTSGYWLGDTEIWNYLESIVPLMGSKLQANID